MEKITNKYTFLYKNQEVAGGIWCIPDKYLNVKLDKEGKENLIRELGFPKKCGPRPPDIPVALATNPTPRRGEGRRCLPAGQITAGVGWTMRSCSETRWVPEQSLRPYGASRD